MKKTVTMDKTVYESMVRECLLKLLTEFSIVMTDSDGKDLILTEDDIQFMDLETMMFIADNTINDTVKKYQFEI